MRINDLLIESTNQLDEGPKFNKFGQAVGNVAGMAAKGIGAVAGGIAGLGAAAKKGFQAGKSQVAAADDGAAPAAKPAGGKPGAVPAGKPAAGGGGGAVPAGKPAAGGGGGAVPAAGGGGGTSAKPKGFIAGVKAGQNQGLSALNDPNVVGSTASAGDDEDPAAGGTTTPPSATDINKAGPKGTAQAKPIQGTVAKQAAAKTGAALAGQDQAQAGQTMYTQVKANIDKLDKKGKQRILQLLQKSMAAPAAEPAPAAGGASPVADRAAKKRATAKSGAGAMGAMAGQLAKGGANPTANTMANAPVSKTNTVKPGNSNQEPIGEPAEPGAVSGFLGFGKQAAAATAPKPAAKSQTLTPQQQAAQAATKARLQGTKAAGKSVAASTTGGFKKFKADANAKGIATASKINTGSLVLEGFSLFRKK